MSQFDKLVEDTLNEGILQRASQRVKNIGRSVKYPFKKMFGDDEESVAAGLSSKEGYKRLHMLADVLKSAVKDLQKLNVLKKDYSSEEITHYICDALRGSEYFNDSNLLSKLGQQQRDSETEISNRKRELDRREWMLRRKEGQK